MGLVVARRGYACADAPEIFFDSYFRFDDGSRTDTRRVARARGAQARDDGAADTGPGRDHARFRRRCGIRGFGNTRAFADGRDRAERTVSSVGRTAARAHLSIVP